MSPEGGDLRPTAIHATAVSIHGSALLIVGRSKAGKSRLAIALIDASTARRPIRLIGDDRVLLSRCAGGLVARPHPRIAGFIERRGLGIVAMRHEDAAPVVAIVDLGRGPAATGLLDGAGLPSLALADPSDDAGRRDVVLRWFPAISRQTHHTRRKTRACEATGS